MNYEAVRHEKVQYEKEDLRRRTKAFALQIIRLYCSLPKSTEAQVLGKQLLRSGTSIGANYREAFRARSASEFIAKLGDSLRELEETAYWLELLAESGIIPEARLSALHDENNQLNAIFVSILKHKKANVTRQES
jgi:four helix bundle protein